LRKVIGWVVARPNYVRFSSSLGILSLSIDSLGSVIKHLVRDDWVFEVTAFLWDMVSYDGSVSKKKIRACSSKHQCNFKTVGLM
jgi:hypothetical protein